MKEIAKQVHVEEFVPQSGLKIEIDKKPGEEEKKQEDNATEDDFAVLEQLKKEVDVAHIGVKSTDFIPADFEKDDDSNYHIDFIHAAA